MDVDVEIQRAAEALHDRHDVAAAIGDAGRAGSAADAAASTPIVEPGTSGKTRSARCVDRSAIRRPLHRGQKPLPLHRPGSRF
jgi:hypothetical protein